MNFVDNIVALAATAVALATGFYALKFRVLTQIHTERLELEKEKTAKEKQARELAEARIKSMLEEQDLILENLKTLKTAIKNTDEKMQKLGSNINANTEQLEKQNKLIPKFKTKANKK